MATPSGWNLEGFLRMTHEWGVRNGYATAVPNCETATYATQVWGVYALPKSSSLVWTDAPGSGLGITALNPVPDAWRAGHRFAASHSSQTGLLTYETGAAAGGQVFGLTQIKNSPLQWRDILVTELETQPGFNQPDMVIRDINRWAVHHGFAWGFPDFEQRAGNYGAFLLPQQNAAFVSWHDVPESEIRRRPHHK